MIFGIGTDILDLRRINKILNKYDQRFIDRIYGKTEIQVSKSKLNYSNNYFGKRFAAKEATWKALSSTRGDGIFFREIEVLNDCNGKPYLFFTGNTEKFIERKEYKLSSRLKFDISLSDDNPYVVALVVISLAPYV